MRYWLQYHNYDKLGYLPGGNTTTQENLAELDTSSFDGGCITTKKEQVKSVIGDVCFLLLGFGKKKKYLLWDWFILEEVGAQDDEYLASGKGHVLNPPATLSGSEFDQLKHSLGNFSLGFSDISRFSYLTELKRLALEKTGHSVP